eukprot:scaffold3526_cov115-Cylindrotheca_fusiformis.AAC.8
MRSRLKATLLFLAQNRAPALLPLATEAFSSNSIAVRYGQRRKLTSRKIGDVSGCQTHFRLYSSVDEPEQRERAYQAFTVLARKNKTWKRLRHLVDMAASRDASVETIADVGTDHGLLAMGLALSGRYQKVLGVDVSEQALRSGALSLLDAVNNHGANSDYPAEGSIPVEFRLSNGLEGITHGEADAICIAGMGVNTMIQILGGNRGSTLQLDEIECKKLLLQPTNSRPRNLILLYDYLQNTGWRLADERIERLSSRWYISVSFVRKFQDKQSMEPLELPTSKLALLEESDKMHQTYKEYVTHHSRWIRQDSKLNGDRMSSSDQRWLAKLGL